MVHPFQTQNQQANNAEHNRASYEKKVKMQKNAGSL
jgi:hypothetical protein